MRIILVLQFNGIAFVRSSLQHNVNTVMRLLTRGVVTLPTFMKALLLTGRITGKPLLSWRLAEMNNYYRYRGFLRGP